MFSIRPLILAVSLATAFVAFPASAGPRCVGGSTTGCSVNASPSPVAAPVCTPAARDMQAAIAACGSGEVKTTPAHKRVVKRPAPRPRVVVRTLVRERVVYRDRPAPTRVRECEPMSWQTRTRDGRWYPARACVYPRYIEGVTLAACNHLSGYYRYPDINEQILVDGRWVLYRTY
jgi:hypothetical protein